MFVITFHFGSLCLGRLNIETFVVVKMGKTTLFLNDDIVYNDTSITCLHFASAGRHLNKSRGGKEEMNERACNNNSGTG